MSLLDGEGNFKLAVCYFWISAQMEEAEHNKEGTECPGKHLVQIERDRETIDSGKE